MTTFSPKTEAILRKSGWRRGRKFDTKRYVEVLELEGYTVFPVVVDFLKQFGGLRITWPMAHKFGAWLDFHVDQIMRNYPRWGVQIFSEGLKIELCPIGGDNNDICFAMGPDGKVYGIYDLIVLFIGNSGEEAIENYYSREPSTPFPVIYTLKDDVEDQSKPSE